MLLKFRTSAPVTPARSASFGSFARPSAPPASAVLGHLRKTPLYPTYASKVDTVLERLGGKRRRSAPTPTIDAGVFER